MIDVSRDKFVTDYVTTFLATWGAKQWDRHGDGAFEAMPPVYSAIHMARLAWVHLLQDGMVRQ
jgi:hypothetical protein